MKIKILPLCLLSLGLVACKSKQVVEEHPPMMESLPVKASMQVPQMYQGEWEICEITGEKSLYTKVILNDSLKITETYYDDEHCQQIESTKEKSVFSLFLVEFVDNVLRAKIQGRKLAIFDPVEFEITTSSKTCGQEEWVLRKTNETLGTTCPGLPRDNKHDLTLWSLTLAGDKLIFNGKEMSRIKEAGPIEEQTESKLINTTNSEVLPEPGHKNVMLVFPPKQETLKIELPAVPHANLKNCPAVLNTHQSSLNALSRIESIEAEIEKEKTRLKQINEEISEAGLKLIEYVEANNLQEYHSLISELEEIENSIEIADMDYRGCDGDCDEIFARLKDLRSKRYEANNKISALRVPRQITRGYYAHIGAIERSEAGQEKQKEVVSAKEGYLKEAKDKLLTIFDHIDRKEGVTGNLMFEGQWKKNLKTLIDANPKLKFHLAPVGTIVMTYKLTGIKDYPGHTTILKFPDPNAISLVKGRVNFKRYPFSMNGSSTVSLIAACPAYDPESFGMKVKQPRMLEYEVTLTYKH